MKQKRYSLLPIKKLFSAFLILAALTGVLPPNASFCLPVAADSTLPSVSAKAAALLDGNSGRLLWGKNEDAVLPMASTTKIMTAYVALRYIEPSRKMTVPKCAVGIEGTSACLREGEVLTLTELLYAMLLQSANDAAATIAVNIAGSVENFAVLMNAEAKRMGLTASHFENPHGLPAKGHETTAKELGTIAAHAMKDPVFRQIVSSPTATIPYPDGGKRYLKNHNRMLTQYDGANGVKTGFTKASGRCLVSSAERNGVCLIAVTLNAPDDWRDHTALLDYGFSVYESVSTDDLGESERFLPVVGGTCAYAVLKADTQTLCIPKDAQTRIRVSVEHPRFLYAPVTAGTKVGTLRVSLDGETLASLLLITAYGIGIAEPSQKNKKILLKRNQ